MNQVKLELLDMLIETHRLQVEGLNQLIQRLNSSIEKLKQIISVWNVHDSSAD